MRDIYKMGKEILVPQFSFVVEVRNRERFSRVTAMELLKWLIRSPLQHAQNATLASKAAGALHNWGSLSRPCRFSVLLCTQANNAVPAV